jgi:carboxypeptidase PM20D1
LDTALLILLPLLAALLLLLAVLVVRTLRFRPRHAEGTPLPPGEPAWESAAEHLAGAVCFPTISYADMAQCDRQAFLGLHDYLAQSFPRVHAVLTREVVGEYSLLYTWPGREPQAKPIVLMAHLDVVPVEAGSEKDWTHPPFSGQIAEGYVWGRGAMDSKFGVIGALEAVESLLAEGFQPQRTVLLAFGCDEEVSGKTGARQIAALLEARGTVPEFILDEGGAVVQGVVPLLKKPVAVVAIAEKGHLSLELTVETAGGHSSTPPRQTTIGILSAAVARLERHRSPARLTGPMRLFFDTLGRELGWPLRLVLANLWLFAPLIERLAALSPEIDAMLRTTTAPTIMHAGVKDNILPLKAQAVVNFRIRPGETVDDVVAHVRRVLGKLPVRIGFYQGDPGWGPSPTADVTSPSYAHLQRTIGRLFPDAIVVPFLETGATDSRYFARLTPNVYRFAPMLASEADLNRVHGTDERVAVEDCRRGVGFYRQLIRGSV